MGDPIVVRPDCRSRSSCLDQIARTAPKARQMDCSHCDAYSYAPPARLEPVTLERIAAAIGVTRERIRQVELVALDHFRRAAIRAGVADDLEDWLVAVANRDDGQATPVGGCRPSELVPIPTSYRKAQ